MADQIGVSRQKYARIESGANHISLNILMKIAGILGVKVGDITRVLDEVQKDAYRVENGSVDKIFDMLDQFYTNKHIYLKLQNKNMA